MNKTDHEQVKALLAEAITVLCKNGLHYSSHVSIQGLLGITLDDREIFLVDIHEKIASRHKRDTYRATETGTDAVTSMFQADRNDKDGKNDTHGKAYPWSHPVQSRFQDRENPEDHTRDKIGNSSFQSFTDTCGTNQWGESQNSQSTSRMNPFILKDEGHKREPFLPDGNKTCDVRVLSVSPRLVQDSESLDSSDGHSKSKHFYLSSANSNSFQDSVEANVHHPVSSSASAMRDSECDLEMTVDLDNGDAMQYDTQTFDVNNSKCKPDSNKTQNSASSTRYESNLGQQDSRECDLNLPLDIKSEKSDVFIDLSVDNHCGRSSQQHSFNAQGHSRQSISWGPVQETNLNVSHNSVWDPTDRVSSQESSPSADLDSSRHSGVHRMFKTRRARTHFKDHQLQELEKAFMRHKYLPNPERALLAETLNLSEYTVRVWFQNRRRIDVNKLRGVGGYGNHIGGHSDQGRGYGDQGRGYGDQGRGYGDQGRGHVDHEGGYGDHRGGQGDHGGGHGDQGGNHGDHGGGHCDQGLGLGDQGRLIP